MTGICPHVPFQVRGKRVPVSIYGQLIEALRLVLPKPVSVFWRTSRHVSWAVTGVG
jgi:hypothetical protein